MGVLVGSSSEEMIAALRSLGADEGDFVEGVNTVDEIFAETVGDPSVETID